jgi:hypothetical protein
MYHFEQYYNLTKSTDWHTRQNFEDFTRDDIEKLESIRRQNIETEFKDFYNSQMFTQACLHLQRIYKTISNRYANEQEEKIEYLTKAYEVSKSSKYRNKVQKKCYEFFIIKTLFNQTKRSDKNNGRIS